MGCESTTHAVANPTNLPSSLSAKVRVVLSLITGITIYPVYLHSPLLKESCMIYAAVNASRQVYLRQDSKQGLYAYFARSICWDFTPYSKKNKHHRCKSMMLNSSSKSTE